ncbi:hypothetical protein BOTBODRAFT_565514 [Botryobasidium botryosum FD-172 SS1]|uniref:Uncharacterized protein n=1 Tax=Botryobasidium botryosum (strain FD-172 SS1) TaxID=930990 RepID=A0A067LYW7_BOTB1|nr:hypothetical protein BOTBODRAFT_565514 [Botryobasidium botryosum FD-172 SS1]
MEDHPSPSRLKRARFAANQPAPLLTLLENEDAAGLSQFGKPGSISPAHPVHGAQGSDSSRLTRTKRPTESRPSAAHPPALRSAHDRCAASYAQRARPSAAEARQVCFSVPQLEESPVAHICRRLQELTISAETDWALSLSADMDVDPSSFVDIDVQAQEAPAYLRPFRLDAGGDVIMHGPCTLHMPPRKPTQKAVFAGDVKRRRLKVSGKRRRSHLLQ